MQKGFEEKNHAELYARYRPTYPNTVAEMVINYSKEIKRDGKLVHMLDVGCGNGQSTVAYQPYFENITAIDTSESQIAEAKKTQSGNIDYIVATAESLPVADESVDLICSGQAIHWVDFSKFFLEARRVLKPDGSMALYGYDLPYIIPAGQIGSKLCESKLKEEVRKLLWVFHESCHFHERIDHVNNKYAEIYKLVPGQLKKRDDNLKIERDWNLRHMEQYLTTYSGYQQYLREQAEAEVAGEDILRNFLDGVKNLWKVEDIPDEKIPVHMSWDIFIILSRRP